ncbi:purine-nucleoside phosphorylase [Serinibacter arcticus]|uniref:purine-nucleoside phosphorylase n=1 Tax=Serinibacter arcticus TaxID=1655435 RepID=A0A2U1ZR06_9MICO|nr:purine-nucleoside phosphorylase [Serinibacter arcticus]PWD49434.1 purine-nucleoside phosphorylase [Serinibacter arcticus]
MSPEDFRAHLLDADDAAAAAHLAAVTGHERHDALVVLGSGLTDVADTLGTATATLRLSELPGVLAPTADGHLDELRSCVLPDSPDGSPGTRVLVALGRTHLYEGVDRRRVTALVRIAAAAGARRTVLTNANGCLRPWKLGDVVAITDHLNLTGSSPFDGGVFLDPRTVWDRTLAAATTAVCPRSGTYAALRGPEYQTDAESRLLAASGADVVGMSTVHEALTAAALGLRAAGLSVVSDLSFDAATTDPQAVLDAAARSRETLATAVRGALTAD